MIGCLITPIILRQINKQQDVYYIKNNEIVREANFTEDDDIKIIESSDDLHYRLIDFSSGYTLKYPKEMKVDLSLAPIRTVIVDEDKQIEIYYDNFSDTINSPFVYTNYSNQFLENKRDHKKVVQQEVSINGMDVSLLMWQRDKLQRVHNDKNYYVSADIVKNEEEVYTVFIKSTVPFNNQEDYMSFLESFKLIERKGTPQFTTTFKNKKRDWNKETAAFYKQYFADDSTLTWGIFENSAPQSFEFLSNLESELNFTFDFLLKYQSLSSEGFPMKEMKNAYEHGRVVELTLQTMFLDGRDNASITYEILDGQHDNFIIEYAKQMKRFGHPVLFRLNNEMNGDWCVYSSYYSSKDTSLYKAVWQYIYRIFEDEGVDNVLWVWNPNDISFPNFKWNHYLNYYPGDEYVDIIGLTGYNTGTYYTGENWREFKAIYDPLYDEYMEVFNKPFMITEFGSNSVGGDKVKWINDMFDRIDHYDHVKVAIWWNGIDWDADKQPARIYRLDENEAIKDIFKDRLEAYR
ncbi:glycoside hydrolase family 26 protein [Vallitalea okinawensis]|uniref:glycoside hydrolase family 26 protein n=1 Tax=Vallitalea okinawensis TaxID=2078660 RepID=UPI001FA82810|nr:glycosyl hydrolase [Vallitalea okinawensis]